MMRVDSSICVRSLVFVIISVCKVFEFLPFVCYILNYLIIIYAATLPPWMSVSFRTSGIESINSKVLG